MKKYVFVYYGGKDHKDMTEEQRKEVMGKWMAWFESMGDKVAEMGSPFADGGQSVTPSGVEAIPADMWPAKGYTVVSAADMNEATEMAKNCPMVVDGEENATVRVYEAMDM